MAAWRLPNEAGSWGKRPGEAHWLTNGPWQPLTLLSVGLQERPVGAGGAQGSMAPLPAGGALPPTGVLTARPARQDVRRRGPPTSESIAHTGSFERWQRQVAEWSRGRAHVLAALSCILSSSLPTSPAHFPEDSTEA